MDPGSVRPDIAYIFARAKSVSCMPSRRSPKWNAAGMQWGDAAGYSLAKLGQEKTVHIIILYEHHERRYRAVPKQKCW